MEVCPEDASWQRWLDGDVERDERALLAAHLNTCDPCCTFVAALDPETRPGGAGLRVDRYDLGELLGAGAMGLVYAAYDPRLERRVAVKLLRTPGSPDERAALSRRMWREACAMAQLSHPNVVTVFDVGVVDDRVFIAMELVSGQSLSAWCRAAPRTLEQRVAVLLAAGDGLAAIHGAGLVHRDFKPDNVLIDGAGRARVSDFGIAAAVGDSVELAASTPTPTLLDRLTMTRSLLGTPAYMAPEQLDGFVADARSDQFGFCVALYESAFDARPFAGTTVLDRRAAIEAGAIRAPLRRDRAARRVFEVVRRGLAVDPAARYPSMRALLDELGPPRRSSRAPWLAAVAAVAMLAAATAYVLGRETGPPPAAAAAVGRGARPAIAVLGLRGSGPDDDSAWLGPAVAELLIAGLAGDELRLTRGEDVARARADGVLPPAGELPAAGPALPSACSTA